MKKVIEASLSNIGLYGNILPPGSFIAGSLNMLSRRPTAFPLSINLLITRRCNYACSMCVSSQCQNGDREAGDLDTTALKKFIHEVSPRRPVFHIGGGEPFVRKDLMEVISFIKRNGLKCLMTTNGFLADEKIWPELAEQVDVLIVSLYGPKEIHDKTVGLDGAYDRTVGHLKALLKMKTKTARVIVSCIALPESVASFPAFFASLKDLRVDAVKIEHLNFLSKAECAASIACKGGDFDLTPSVYVRDQEFPAGFVRALLRLREKVPGMPLPVYMKPYLTGPQISDWYLGFPGRDPECRFITHSVFINYNGDIIPCQFLTRCVLGNIQKDRLEDVWRSASYQNLRKTIREVCPKVCMRCCKN